NPTKTVVVNHVVVALANTFETIAIPAKKEKQTSPMMRVLGGCCNRRALPAALGCRRLRATQPIIRLMIIVQSVHCIQESLREAKAIRTATCTQLNEAVSRPLEPLLLALWSSTLHRSLITFPSRFLSFVLCPMADFRPRLRS